MTALRVAVLAEGETDDAVAREIVAHVQGAAVTPVGVASLRTRGVHGMLRQLPLVVRTVYYQTDADALVVLADADVTVPHDPLTHVPDMPHAGCRWCALNTALANALQGLRPRPTGRPLRTAVGTPVPALEAWLLAGLAPRPSEAAWRQRGTTAAAASEEYKRQLKRAAYGSGPPAPDRVPTASRLIRRALAVEGLLRAEFPGGYGPLEDAIRAW